MYTFILQTLRLRLCKYNTAAIIIKFIIIMHFNRLIYKSLLYDTFPSYYRLKFKI